MGFWYIIDYIHFQIKSIDGSKIKAVKNIENVVLTIDTTGKQKFSATKTAI